MRWWPPAKIEWNDRPAARARVRALTKIAKSFDEPDRTVAEEHHAVPMRDGHSSDLWVFRPKSEPADGISPLIVLIHGGGLVVGGPIECAATARAAVKRFGAVVAVPTYRLAPESPFPTQVNDSWDNFIWIARNASTTLRADPSAGFVIAGESAGASLSVIMTRLARDQGIQPKLTGLWLSAVWIPFRDQGSHLPPKYREKYLSMKQPECAENPVYPPELADLLKESLGIDESSELSDPSLWSAAEAHKNFPRTYFQICGRDARRDEGLIYRDMLEEAGVPTKMSLYKGLPHSFWTSIQQVPEYAQWQKDCMSGLAWLLDI